MYFSSAAALAALAACQPKTAATATVADSSPAVATVNGSPISRDFYEFYIKGITGKNAADLTPQQRDHGPRQPHPRASWWASRPSRKACDKNGDTAYLLQLSRLNVLEQAVSDKYLKDRKPTEQELRAEYETQIGTMPKLEYHARHILVATEPFAQKIVDRLDKGEKFEDIAKRESMDSSKTNGGDLGWFTPDRMLPEFSGAVMALKPGEYTKKPVQTQYGWHVIQLVDTRDLAAPQFDQVKQRLEQVVQAKKFRSYMDELMRTAKIEKLDQPATPAAATAPAAAPAAPAAAGHARPGRRCRTAATGAAEVTRLSCACGRG